MAFVCWFVYLAFVSRCLRFKSARAAMAACACVLALRVALSFFPVLGLPFTVPRAWSTVFCSPSLVVAGIVLFPASPCVGSPELLASTAPLLGRCFPSSFVAISCSTSVSVSASQARGLVLHGVFSPRKAAHVACSASAVLRSACSCAFSEFMVVYAFLHSLPSHSIVGFASTADAFSFQKCPSLMASVRINPVAVVSLLVASLCLSH
ncbi:hypothetical protein TRVL_07298 [Trypanosoma vivax]|nr:hypothetical protein TRVL_07298 [Trypanosoma vivax]